MGILLLASLVFLGFWILRGPVPDPGRRVLHQLQPAAQALPSDAHVIYRYDLEPKWDSCDGRPGTFGWDNVILQIHFQSRTPTMALVEHADQTLRRLGWSHVYDTSGQVAGLSSWTAVRSRMLNFRTRYQIRAELPRSGTCSSVPNRSARKFLDAD